MSAWYIFNSLGFYPVNPASGEYLIGSPIFDQVSVTFPQNNANLVIVATEARDKQYIQGVSLDGVPLKTPVLKHSELMLTHEIHFEMSSDPQIWGKDTL